MTTTSVDADVSQVVAELRLEIEHLNKKLSDAQKEIECLRWGNTSFRSSSEGDKLLDPEDEVTTHKNMSEFSCQSDSKAESNRLTAIQVKSPLTWWSFSHVCDGENELCRWWLTWCPICKRPLDFLQWKDNDGHSEDRCSNHDTIYNKFIERDGDVEEQEELFRLRNNAVVRKILSGCPIESSYEIVWPLQFAGRKIWLEHLGFTDPLKHSGGRLGPCYDIVGRVIKIEGDQVWIPKSLKAKSRFAYVVAMWGGDPGLVLGALVLAGALQRTGSTHDRVLLHTDDLPTSSRDILAVAWKLVRVEYVEAHGDLFHMRGTRFDGVFTKLHALSLVDYEKVLMLDIDLVVASCPDELFDLPAPAAMHRGISGAPHGSKIDGRWFFAGEFGDVESGVKPWGQQGGINCGVMLLKPDENTYKLALQEVLVPFHPERIAGSGPEQDYLSRLFAPDWTHMSVVWNFQIHRVFHALEAMVTYAAKKDAQEPEWAPERSRCKLDDVRIFHCSGTTKPWHQDGETNAEFSERLLRDQEYQYSRWVECTSAEADYEQFGVRTTRRRQFLSINGNVDITHVVEHGVHQARLVAGKAMELWRQDRDQLRDSFPCLPALSELRRRLDETSWAVDAPFKRGARVEAWFKGNWYRATVSASYEYSRLLSVVFDEPGSWGSEARGLSYHCLRPVGEYAVG